MVATPLGDMLIGGADGVVKRLYLDGVAARERHPEWTRADGLLAQAAAELRAYFDGQLREFTVALAPDGDQFEREVWNAISAIGYATRVSYGSIATRLGDANGARAVGAAVGRNPIAIMIPCHRVVGSDGSLVGYGGGLHRKRWLLEHESRVVSEQADLFASR